MKIFGAYLNEHLPQLVRGLLRPLALLGRHDGQFLRGFAAGKCKVGPSNYLNKVLLGAKSH